MDIRTLKSVPIFSGIDEAVLAELLTIVEERACSDGQTVFAQGDEGDALYVIAAGAVKVVAVIDKEKNLTKDLAILTQGDFVGEMSLIDSSPRSASVVSLGDSTLLRISRSGFQDLLQKSATTAANLLFGIIRTVSGRLRQTNTELVTLYETGKAIGEADDLASLLAVVFNRLMQATGASRGLVVLKNELAGGIEIKQERGYATGSSRGWALSETAGMLGAVFTDGTASLVADLDSDDRFKSLPRVGFESPAMLIIPLQTHQTRLGVIFLGHESANRFNANQLNLCLGVATQTSQALLNARHKEEEAGRASLKRQYVRF